MRDAQVAVSSSFSVTGNRAVIIEELRRRLPRIEAFSRPHPFGLATIDAHLPEGGLTSGGLHEIVPEAEGATAAAFGFVAAVLGRLPKTRPLVWVSPAYSHGSG